jgi:hypothetical protein
MNLKRNPYMPICQPINSGTTFSGASKKILGFDVAGVGVPASLKTYMVTFFCSTAASISRGAVGLFHQNAQFLTSTVIPGNVIFNGSFSSVYGFTPS